jgi:hypothetical protein
MSSAIEDDEADLRDGLSGLPLARTTLEVDEVRWIGVVVDLAEVEVAVVGEVGEVVGKGTEVGVICWWGNGRTPRGGVGGGEGSCWSWSSSLGM